MTDKFDFSGYVTRYGLLCSDDRIIAENAFDDCNDKVVPLTYNFHHNDMPFVIGSVTLESRSDGVYGYCKLNDSPCGRVFRMLVKDHIFKELGIYAKIDKGKDNIVTHGIIQEVALVQYGACPGAWIDYYGDTISSPEFQTESLISRYQNDTMSGIGKEKKDD